jgi:isoaspartyl peptidase/L-asparaginase-like protein (Ntn-hydrolase superfamily)
MRAGATPQQAADRAIEVLGRRVQGKAGVIVIGRDGTPAWARNTATMTYAYVGLDGSEHAGS